MATPHSTSRHFQPIGTLSCTSSISSVPRPPSDFTSLHPSLQQLLPRAAPRVPCRSRCSNNASSDEVTAHIASLWLAVLLAVRDNPAADPAAHPLFRAHVAPTFHCTQDFEPGMPEGFPVTAVTAAAAAAAEAAEAATTTTTTTKMTTTTTAATKQTTAPAAVASVTAGWPAHVEAWRATMARNPGYGARMRDVAIDLQADGMRARTWTFKEITGLPGGVRKESVALGRWEKRDGVWMITSIDMRRGVLGGWT